MLLEHPSDGGEVCEYMFDADSTVVNAQLILEQVAFNLLINEAQNVGR
jgi:hypothetical protein